MLIHDAIGKGALKPLYDCTTFKIHKYYCCAISLVLNIVPNRLRLPAAVVNLLIATIAAGAAAAI
jgi:hypothetical protein